MTDRQGIPEELPKGQVIAGMRSMGLAPENVVELHLSAHEDVARVLVYSLDATGSRYLKPGTDEPATETLEVRLI